MLTPNVKLLSRMLVLFYLKVTRPGHTYLHMFHVKPKTFGHKHVVKY